MKSEEPTTCLVNTLSNEVCREACSIVQLFLILKRIVNLSIRHSTRVKPYVDKVELASKNSTTLSYQLDVVNIGTV